MIALAQANDLVLLYRAVTIGNAWNFGKLDRTQQTITQDLTLHRVPDDLESLMEILIGILEGKIGDS